MSITFTVTTYYSFMGNNILGEPRDSLKQLTNKESKLLLQSVSITGIVSLPVATHNTEDKTLTINQFSVENVKLHTKLHLVEIPKQQPG